MQVAERRLLLICSGVCALIVLDTNIVAVSLPAVARALHADFADLEWIVSAYMLAFASLLLPAGSLADRFGRRRMMLVGLGLFSLASLACGLSVSILMLQLARAVKGVGAAMLLTSALAVIGHVFHTEAARTKAWAVWGACMGVSMTVAPLLGGLITQWLGWRWIFLLNLPVCLSLALLALRHVGESADTDADAARLDPLGAILFSGGLGCLIWALIHASADGWQDTATVWRLVTGVLMLLLFVPVELRQQRPMIDLRLFLQASFTGAVLAMFGYAAAAQVMMTFLPLYLQNAFASSAVGAGLAMLPFALMMMLFPRVAALLSQRWPLHVVMAIGMALVAMGNLVVALAANLSLYWLVLGGMMITGSGAGMLNGNTQKAIMLCVPRARTGMASGISTTTRFTAIVLAVACLGCILSMRTSSYMQQGFAAAQLPLPADAGNVVSRVVAGDSAAALMALGNHLPALQIVQTGFTHAFSVLMLVAAGLAASCGVLLFWLMGCIRRQSQSVREVTAERI
ncbi:EmrB/QacA subfamily drug resistance transporter [Herbaspirillum sp. Sphag1AN]|uniref:MFS transporter n=1 Tax=unclassified Herbaspirillum TaxID=2624150 RepID=UPI00161B482D|nr:MULTISPECIES: MFS transporter [unclassified Herbaspirillum]MBB3212301.1 EmrB/QacA subfamily drug resistance transporter [Herbaspirillum sp. Sphag1AN]MBB3245601.1 EmrB/QacA subfamily drug resistance transporter [Herbaspirillum sp. Sphag64]